MRYFRMSGIGVWCADFVLLVGQVSLDDDISECIYRRGCIFEIIEEERESTCLGVKHLFRFWHFSLFDEFKGTGVTMFFSLVSRICGLFRVQARRPWYEIGRS